MDYRELLEYLDIEDPSEFVYFETLADLLECEEYIEPEREQENLNLNDISKTLLEKALERNHGNRKKAAMELGISDRTLYRRLKQYGLDK